jgi:hypothetical protein
VKKERSERVDVRLPASLAKKVREEAARLHTTVTAVVVRAVEEHLAGGKPANVRDAALFSRAAFELLLAYTTKGGGDPDKARRVFVGKAAQAMRRREREDEGLELPGEGRSEG